MSTIQADVNGLSVLAANCQEQATVVSSVNTAPPEGSSFQPSAAAVASAQADVAAAQARFAARLQSTAADVTIAAHEYALTESNSASAVASVSVLEA